MNHLLHGSAANLKKKGGLCGVGRTSFRLDVELARNDFIELVRGKGPSEGWLQLHKIGTHETHVSHCASSCSTIPRTRSQKNSPEVECNGNSAVRS
jgi:hypothetical protein